MKLSASIKIKMPKVPMPKKPSFMPPMPKIKGVINPLKFNR